MSGNINFFLVLGNFGSISSPPVQLDLEGKANESFVTIFALAKRLSTFATLDQGEVSFIIFGKTNAIFSLGFVW